MGRGAGKVSAQHALGSLSGFSLFDEKRGNSHSRYQILLVPVIPLNGLSISKIKTILRLLPILLCVWSKKNNMNIISSFHAPDLKIIWTYQCHLKSKNFF